MDQYKWEKLFNHKRKNILLAYGNNVRAVFLTARINSSRLPTKMLTKFGMKTLIELDIERAKKSDKADEVILCTTKDKEDDILCWFANAHNILFYRGSEEDKLQRWLDCAEKYEVDFFVNFDGDDPFCEPELMDLAFKQFNRRKPDFIKSPETPCGAFTYGIKTAALRRVCKKKDTTDTEMIQAWFTDTGMFKVEDLERVPEEFKGHPEYRLTLDYSEDINFFKVMFNYFQHRSFNLYSIMECLRKNPEFVKINSHLQERFLENQKAKTKVVLKDVQGAVSSL